MPPNESLGGILYLTETNLVSRPYEQQVDFTSKGFESQGEDLVLGSTVDLEKHSGTSLTPGPLDTFLRL